MTTRDRIAIIAAAVAMTTMTVAETAAAVGTKSEYAVGAAETIAADVGIDHEFSLPDSQAQEGTLLSACKVAGEHA